MASALLDELKTMATVVKKSQIENAVGSSWASLVAEEDPQGRRIGILLVEARAGVGGGRAGGYGRGERGGRWGRGGETGERGSEGAEQREQWEDPLAT